MAIIRTILGLVVTIPVAIFSGLNAQSVDVVYSPFHEAASVSLYVIIIGFALFGALYGSLSTWLNGGFLRKDRRRLKKRVKHQDKKLGQLQKKPGCNHGDDSIPVAKIEKETPISQDE
ncbi:MAG: LapA family protein [Alphaproteobacteria bacterium]|nr:LapA family protein [Alphaproteobacteria bacterium]